MTPSLSYASRHTRKERNPSNVFPIPDVNAEPGVETIETQTVEKELYKRSSSSQAPWEINEDVAKTLLDRRTPADGDVRPGTRMATPIPVHRASAITWTELMINTLLDVYEEKYFLVERGNLKKRHWKDIVTEFNHKSGLVLAKENLRSKLDNLKKKYKLETELIANASGGIRSSWNMYDRCDILWGCTPKRGLPGGFAFEIGDTRRQELAVINTRSSTGVGGVLPERSAS